MSRQHLILFGIVMSWVAACDKGSAGEPGSPAKTPAQASPSSRAKAPDPTLPPVEPLEPNVPENEPAFPQQTRAKAVRTQTPLTLQVRVSGLSHPWALAVLPDRRMLLTERPGRLLLLSTTFERTQVEGVPKVDARDQGGLLDVALAPDFEASRAVYLSYYEPRRDGNGLTVARAKLVERQQAVRLEGLQVIFRMLPTMDSTKHCGGRVLFSPEGELFVTLGERSILAGRLQAQDLSSHLGKIVRIHSDGSVPEDNPFTKERSARPEIWSLGHRNVLGAAFDARGRLWAHEMGPRGGDELNLIRKGADYGWPTIGYGEEYSGKPIHESTKRPGMEQPIYYWDPSISPSGMTFYAGNAIPEWRGNVLLGALSGMALVRLVLRDDRVMGEERLFQHRARIRDVVEGPDGHVFLLTDSHPGELLELMPRAGANDVSSPSR